MRILFLFPLLFPGSQELREAIRALESPSAAQREAAEKTIRDFPALLAEEVSLRDALDRQGPETRHRIASILAAREDAFPLLVRWARGAGAVAEVAQESLSEVYRGFRGGKIPPPAQRGELGESPEDAMRRVWVSLPPEGISFLAFLDSLHRREWLVKPLLLAPEESWESWKIENPKEEGLAEEILGPFFMKALDRESPGSRGRRTLHAYSGFLWLSADAQVETEEAIFLRLCRALRADNAESRRTAALNLGRLGFGPAEKLFADALVNGEPLGLDWCAGFFGGQGVSPWLRERRTIAALIRNLPRLKPQQEAIVATLRTLGRLDAAGQELATLYETESKGTSDTELRSILARLID